MNSLDTLYHNFIRCKQITTDTRNIIPDSIFFALKGASFDGNQFAKKALELGCCLAVVDDPELKNIEGCLFFQDVLMALQDLAIMYRKSFSIPFIGITGTNGKTTTKELIKAVLAKKYRVIATSGNLNNHIGVPLTILSIPQDTEIAVIEMGANHPGEIADLCRIAMPTHGIITNIGKAHLEGFGGYEGVIKTKNELYDYIRVNKGHLFVNEDNRLLMDLAKQIPQVNYGVDALYCSGSIVPADSFLSINYKGNLIKTNLVGNYNFENILSACCIGKFFSVNSDLIQNALEDYVPTNNRSQIVKRKTNTIIMDAYNANPSSMSAAIKNIGVMDAPKKVLILGDMFELGEASFVEHTAICQLINRYVFDVVILVGMHFSEMATQFKYDGFLTTSDALSYLRNLQIMDSTILLKGSRGMKMELLLEAFDE